MLEDYTNDYNYDVLPPNALNETWFEVRPPGQGV